MCDICHFSRCPSSCPNAPEPPIFGKCAKCGEVIYDDDVYYEIDEKNYCEACVYESYRTAEVDYERN